jgi:hypothetical protein
VFLLFVHIRFSKTLFIRPAVFAAGRIIYLSYTKAAVVVDIDELSRQKTSEVAKIIGL